MIFFRLIAAAALCAAANAHAAAPLVVPHGHLGEAGRTLLPNFLLNLSLTVADAGAAYREPYSGTQQYAGYFNPRLCYTYPAKVKGSVVEPELGASGYFLPSQAAGARYECDGAAFSGNLLNWATATTLDLLR